MIVAALLVTAASASAQTAQHVAVIINEESDVSRKLGQYYVNQRAIPPSNVVRIHTTADAEAIDRAVYTSTIEQPIAAALKARGLQDRILYIVLTKGVPLRVSGSGGQNGTVASVDSELTLLYRRMVGAPVTLSGRIENPYFLGRREVSEARAFTRRDHDIYLVTRLDAFTVDQAMALVDKAKAPVTEGRIVLDKRVPLVNRTGDDWLELSARRIAGLGHGARVVLESTLSGARDVRPVLGYYSWGSNDRSNRVRTVGMGFVPGALAATFVSSDARTFREPPADWMPGDSPDTAAWFEGSPQSLVGDLIREGATGVAGHVAEPYLDSTVRPEILFPAYLSGHNLVESFYLAIPYLSWQTVVIGDPLCVPFPRRPVARSDIDGGSDPETELPAFFAKRRLARAVLAWPGVSPASIVLAVRAEGQLARGDLQAARGTFERATQLAPHAAMLHLQLALLYDRVGERALAKARYARVIQLQPGNALALNNLAFTIATEDRNLMEALPLARRAVAAAPQDGGVVDTLAWIEHLMGDNTAATGHIATAIRLSPSSSEVRVHAALIAAAAGAHDQADQHLAAAVRLDPAVDKREDVRQLRAALEKRRR